jgi:hypothetical protein
VTGEPETDKNEGTDMPTEVTVPPPPVAVMVSVPVPGVNETPEPATRFIMPGKLARSLAVKAAKAAKAAKAEE